MNNKYTATITIGFPSVDIAIMTQRVLAPELGVNTKMKVEDSIIILSLEGKTIATLRALINSYLRWISLIKQVSSLKCQVE